jgi:hypothetical protein
MFVYVYSKSPVTAVDAVVTAGVGEHRELGLRQDLGADPLWGIRGGRRRDE